MPLPLNLAARAALAQPGIPAPPVTIQETSGPKRSVVLRGRSLPYRGVVWEGEQRVEIKYFPGNPVGYAQILGHRFMPTTMRGTWRDSYLADQDSRVELRNFPPVAATARPGSGFAGGPSFASAGSIPGAQGFAETARVTRDALEKIKRSGQLLRVEWGSLVRFGFLRRTAFTHGEPTGGESDIGWELEFDWIGDTSSVPRPQVPARLDAAGLAARLAQSVTGALDTAAAGVSQVYANVPVVTQAFSRLVSTATDTLDTLGQLTDITLVPATLIGVLDQQLGSLKGAAKGLADAVRAVPAAYTSTQEGGTTVDSNDASGLAAVIEQNALRLGLIADDAQRTLAEQLTPDILAFVLATGGETLRDLAYRYYGDSSLWTEIYSYNSLTSSQLVRGQTVVIPRLD